jgi:hypothetical protein
MQPNPQSTGTPGTSPAYPHQIPQKKRIKSRRIVLIGGAIMLGLCGICGIAGIAMSGDKTKNRSAAQGTTAAAAGATTEAKATESKPTAKADPGLNTPVKDGKFQFTITAVECGKTSVGSGYVEKKAQGQYCIVSLTVKNTGKEPQTFFDANQKGLAANGAKYSTDSAAGIAIANGQPTWINEINPGNQIQGSIVFDVPAGVKLTKLELHDSAFSGGVIVTIG